MEFALGGVAVFGGVLGGRFVGEDVVDAEVGGVACVEGEEGYGEGEEKGEGLDGGHGCEN